VPRLDLRFGGNKNMRKQMSIGSLVYSLRSSRTAAGGYHHFTQSIYRPPLKLPSSVRFEASTRLGMRAIY